LLKPSPAACIGKLDTSLQVGQRLEVVLPVDALATNAALLETNDVGFVTVTPSTAKVPKIAADVLKTIQAQQKVPIRFIPDSYNLSPVQINSKAALPLPATFGKTIGTKGYKAALARLNAAMKATKAEGFSGIYVPGATGSATAKTPDVHVFSSNPAVVKTAVLAYETAAVHNGLTPILTGYNDKVLAANFGPFQKPLAGTDIFLQSVGANTTSTVEQLGFSKDSLMVSSVILPANFTVNNAALVINALKATTTVRISNLNKTAITANELQLIESAIAKADASKELTNWRAALASILGKKAVNPCDQLTAAQLKSITPKPKPAATATTAVK